MTSTFRVGVDTGGTFTDLVALVDDGRLLRKKVLSTPDDFSRGVLQALQEICEDNALSPSGLAGFVHGTTVATNAILEKSGPPVGLLTTAGFRDVLEIGRCCWGQDVYDLDWVKEPCIVPREARLEVEERIAADGTVLKPLDLADAERALRTLSRQGIKSLAVCLLNSYVDPRHEIALHDLAKRVLPGVQISISSDVLGEMGEYERTSTTAINAYLIPVVDRYLARLEAALAGLGYTGRLLVMQSNGGLLSGALARRTPVQIVESGPAAGVLACCYLAQQTGCPDIIAFDMGGTTAKASLIEGGRPFEAREYHVGHGMNHGHGSAASGQVIRTPSIEIAEVGAGGGSLAWLDAGGVLRVGPRSAGAAPGPACYDLGGIEPTVTDSYAALGYLNPAAIAGGSRRIDIAQARAAIGTRIAEPGGMSIEDAAYGIYQVATSNMIRAIRAVTVERGRDARDYTLVAFGGAGPMHAAELARELNVSRVLVPSCSGVFSAVGLLMADIRRDRSRTFMRLASEIDAAGAAELSRVFAELEAGARADLALEAVAEAHAVLERLVALQYVGQDHELVLPAPAGPLTQEVVRRLAEDFLDLHERTYGYKEPLARVRLATLRVSARAVAPKPGYADIARQTLSDSDGAPAGPPTRRCYFGPAQGWAEAPIVRRAALIGACHAGPLIVEEFDTTVLVPPGAAATLDDYNNLIVTPAATASSALERAAGDPITIELVKNALSAITDEMAVTLTRTARSIGVKAARDFSVALCDAQGQLVTGGVGLALHIGSIPAAMAAMLTRHGATLAPGDVIITNDPYSGGMHLPDLFVFKPIHVGERLLGFSAAVAHMADIGGRVPGGNAADCVDIYQEGLRLPPIKLYDAGRLVAEWFTVIEANVRLPELVRGDIQAQVAACTAAETKLCDMADKLGLEVFSGHMQALIAYGERMARAALRTIPPGRYEFADQLDDDGVGGGPVRIRAVLEITPDVLRVDLTGTAPQVRGAINAPLAITHSTVAYVAKAVIGREIPNNAGFPRILDIVAPEASVVNMAFPAACAARAVTAYRTMDALLGAFAKVLPGRVPAAGDGGPTMIGVGGEDAAGKPFVFIEVLSAAVGGRPGSDGQEGVSTPIANTHNTSAELIELTFPLRVERYEFVADTAGAGMHRGGVAIRRDVRFLGRRATLQIRSDRATTAPWGLNGGGPGQTSANCVFQADGTVRKLPSKVTTEIFQGDVWRHTSAGGGGWGDPAVRSDADIDRDLRDGKLTPAAAQALYGARPAARRVEE